MTTNLLERPTTILAPRELGVPVKSVNWARVFTGQRRNGEPLILTCMGQDAGGLFVCDVDPATGHCSQYAVGIDKANFPTAAYFSTATGVLYVASAFAGRLHRYDANLPVAQRTLEDLGEIAGEACRFPCQIDEAPDGTIYIGGYSGCSLTRFSPATGEFTHLGRMDETDMYFYPLCGADGTVAGLVKVCKPHVVVVDPATGRHRRVGPVLNLQEAGKGGANQHLDLIKAEDGLLYIVSSQGDFRLQGNAAVAVERAPAAAAPSTLPSGATAEFEDGDRNGHRTLRINNSDGTTGLLPLNWAGGGTGLYLVHEGPDGMIYGSSRMPEHLFRCEPDGSAMCDLGSCSVSIGEAYSMANLDGKIYIASYPQGRFSIYDPALPYNFGEAPGCNPRDIGRLDEIAHRPRAMLAGPAGRVWVGSIPNNGMWGGTLTWYDPATGETRSHRHLVQDCSVTGLAWYPEAEQILVATWVQGGSGTTPRAKQAKFVFWDPYRDEEVDSDDFGLDLSFGIMDLLYAGDHMAYAIVVADEGMNNDGTPRLPAQLVLLDLQNRCVIDASPFHEPHGPIEVSLRQAADGTVYGCCVPSFYRIKPGSAQREVLWSTDPANRAEHIHAPGPIVDRKYYFGSEHRLRVFDLPGDADE